MIWWPLKKLPQVIHVWLSEFPFHEILCLAFYSFLYKKCIYSKETLVVENFVKKKKIYLGRYMSKMNRDQLQQHHFFCPSLMKMEKKAETAYCIILTLFLMNCRSCVQRKKKWNDLNYYYPENVTFLTNKKHVFSTILSVASTSSIHSIVIGCLLFVRFWPTFCKHMLLPKIVQLQKKELDEFLSRFAEINCLPIRIHE